jgi:predicted nucleic acid binding AN1-type Zn finger protein
MVKNPKCAFCNKKTSIVDSLSSTCKCRNVYCLKHRLPENHECNYNYLNEINKDEEIAKLKCVKEMPKI